MRAFYLCFLLVISTLHAANPMPVTAKNGMAVSSSGLASEVGIEIMKKGGNAIDAATAMGFALAVTYPFAGNIGGGGFMMVHLADGRVVAIDMRERAPLTAHRDMFLDESGEVVRGLSLRSHQAAGVPGTVDGLLKAHEAYGKLPRAEVLAPAIRLAEQGFPLTENLAEQFKLVTPAMANYPASLAVFTKNGEPYEIGEVWKQPDLAKTLKLIAEKGRAGFYEGETAALIVAEMERGEGLISRKDLLEYRAVERKPIEGTYRGYQIWSMPPPSSGGLLLVHILNILEAYDVGELGWGSAELVHLMVEAERRAYADRAEYLGDPDFVENPIEKLTSKDYARERFSDFQPFKATESASIKGGVVRPESSETTHFATMDAAGNAVSCTVTLNGGYGNKVVVTGAGFLLNNEMDDFSAKPGKPNMWGLLGSEANSIQPGKRMLSSMTPTIVTKDGKPFLLIGSPGGSTIITTVLQCILNVIDHEMNISEAISAPRFHHQWLPDRVVYERFAIPPDALKLLQLKGHQNLEPYKMPWFNDKIGAAHGILRRGDQIEGAADPRRGNTKAYGF